MAESYETPRRAPSSRKHRSKFLQFLHRYYPSILLVLLFIFCIACILFTVSTISGMLHAAPG